jgi:hypothetical protein
MAGCAGVPGVIGLEDQDPHQSLQAGGDGRQLCKLIDGLQQQQADTGVLHDVADVLGAVVGVKGHRDQTQAQGGHVEIDPLRPVTHLQSDPVPETESLAAQRGLPTARGLRRLTPTELRPAARFRIATHIGHSLGRAARAFYKQARQGGRLVCLDDVGAGRCVHSHCRFAIRTDVED